MSSLTGDNDDQEYAKFHIQRRQKKTHCRKMCLLMNKVGDDYEIS